MVLRFFSLLFSIIISMQVFADHAYPTIDVYGTQSKIATKIINSVGDDLELYAHCFASLKLNAPKVGCTPEQQNKLKQKIINKVNKLGFFSYIDIVTIVYHDHKFFTTIDLLEKKESKRVAYFSSFSKQIEKNNNKIKRNENLERLLNEWGAYEEIGWTLFAKGEAQGLKNCPVYHCTMGFEHFLLKKYLAIFNEGSKYKAQLIETLRNDSDEKRRGTAAFLLAHIKDGQELIDILTPSLSDSSPHVRNNVMRVLIEAIAIVKPIDFDIHPIVMAIDSPTLTDRNKALYVMRSLVNQDQYVPYVIKHAGASLMASLKMKQPNLHYPAYDIFCKISGECYSDRDYIGWEKWLEEQKG